MTLSVFSVISVISRHSASSLDLEILFPPTMSLWHRTNDHQLVLAGLPTPRCVIQVIVISVQAYSCIEFVAVTTDDDAGNNIRSTPAAADLLVVVIIQQLAISLSRSIIKIGRTIVATITRNELSGGGRSESPPASRVYLYVGRVRGGQQPRRERRGRSSTENFPLPQSSSRPCCRCWWTARVFEGQVHRKISLYLAMPAAILP